MREGWLCLRGWEITRTFFTYVVEKASRSALTVLSCVTADPPDVPLNSATEPADTSSNGGGVK